MLICQSSSVISRKLSYFLSIIRVKDQCAPLDSSCFHSMEILECGKLGTVDSDKINDSYSKSSIFSLLVYTTV